MRGENEEIFATMIIGDNKCRVGSECDCKVVEGDDGELDVQVFPR